MATSAQDPHVIRGMFSAVAPSYDRLNRILSGRLDQHWRRAAARAALEAAPPAARVLDLATGTGDLAVALRQAGAGCVVGADFTRPMLARGRAKFGTAGHRWVEADGTRLPFATGAFAALTVAFGLRNTADRPAALREMARVVRPGGRVAILEFGQPRPRLLAAAYDFYSFQLMPRVGRLLSGSDAYLYLARSIREFYTAPALAEAMRSAGLHRIRMRAFLGGIVYLHVGTVPP